MDLAKCNPLGALLPSRSIAHAKRYRWSQALAKPSLQELEDRLGYSFEDKGRLRLALTHASLRYGSAKSGTETDDNERLEFLGDRVLGLIIAERLEEYYPQAREGELAKWFNRLVRKETCADVARQLQLGPHIKMSQSEAENGGRNKKTILADACEALLGAIFLDAGYEKAREIVRNYWDPRLSSQSEAPIDAKSALQEWALAQHMPLPQYVEVSREGPPHMPKFISEVRLDGLQPEQGQGGSKRVAEQNAAQRMLEREGVWTMNDNF